MHAKAIDLSADAGLKRIFANDVIMHRAAIKRLFQLARAIVRHWTEEGTDGIVGVAGTCEVFRDEPLRHGMNGDKPGLAALAVNSEMHHALAAVQVAQPQPAEFLAAHAVIEQGGENGAVTDAIER